MVDGRTNTLIIREIPTYLPAVLQLIENLANARLPGTENPNLATGDIEIIPSDLKILNRADTLPFPIDAEPQNEDLRMAYRYFDLRRPRLARSDAALMRPAASGKSRQVSQYRIR